MNQKIIIPFCIGLFFLFISSCKNDNAIVTAEPFFKNIGNQEAFELIKQNSNNKSFIIFDIRTPVEFDACHIAGAININYYDPDFEGQINKLDKAKTYLIYCHMGSRSKKVFELMKTLNFKYVYNLQTGYYGWAQTDYPKSCD